MKTLRYICVILISAMVGSAHSQQPEAPVPAGKWVVLVPPLGYDLELQRLAIDDYAPRARWWVILPPSEKLSESRENCELLIQAMQKFSLHAALDDPNQDHLMHERQDELAKCERSDGSDLFRPNRSPYPPLPK
jgi:hypothetical protein